MSSSPSSASQYSPLPSQPRGKVGANGQIGRGDKGNARHSGRLQSSVQRASGGSKDSDNVSSGIEDGYETRHMDPGAPGASMSIEGTEESSGNISIKADSEHEEGHLGGWPTRRTTVGETTASEQTGNSHYRNQFDVAMGEGGESGEESGEDGADEDEAVFYGRRELESDSSEYQPSDKSTSPEPVLMETPMGTREREHESSDGDSDAIESILTGRKATSLPNRKRSHRSLLSDPFLDVEGQPLKRFKGALNHRYLEVLNEDEADAQTRYVADAWPKLAGSQVGLTVWTADEKEMFYESLSRLGQDDIAGIAARVKSKGQIEVRQYLHLLRQNVARQRAAIKEPLHKPLLSDFPAAAEISEACCSALEQAADDVALRDEDAEEQEEVRRWGPNHVLTGSNARYLTQTAIALAQDNDDPRVAQLESAAASAVLRPEARQLLAFFKVPTMLQVSERIFMNGALEDYNWGSVGEPPAIRMTAVADLYSLVRALTQRLVTAAADSSMLRHRVEKRRHPGLKPFVRKKDVYRAVACLGLKKNSDVFWARCARRLHLRVYRNEAGISSPKQKRRRPRTRKTTEDNGEKNEAEDAREVGASEPMSYAEVEAEFFPNGVPGFGSVEPGFDFGSSSSESGELSPSDSENETELPAADGSGNSGSPGQGRDADNEDDELTRRRVEIEVDEIVKHTAAFYPGSGWARASLAKRIRAELKEEAYADAVDKHESAMEELCLWSVLEREPLPALGFDQFQKDKSPHVDGFSVGQKRFPLDEVVHTGDDWREKLQYEGEWEAAAAEVERRASVNRKSLA